MTTHYITPELFTFLRELKANNNREWFEANKRRYEKQVREPLLDFVIDFGLRLPEISPHYLADARKSGGSLFRIYRDVRFSKDKSPYKTHAGIQFRHDMGKDVHAPGFYLHLEPDEVFVGVGIWHPDSQALGKIRDAIVDDPDRWLAVKTDAAFSRTYDLAGDSLTRPPKGYEADHPHIEDLKRKDFIAVAAYSEAAAVKPEFIDEFTGCCRNAAPFMAFLTTSMGLPW